MDIVVVGASLAGLRMAEALRRAGFAERIVLVGEEVHKPYDRPPLSKEVLTRKAGADDIRLRDDAGLDDLSLELRLGVSAVRLDPSSREVGLNDGTTLRGDVVVLATGSRPRRLPQFEGPEGVRVLRTLEDSLAIREAMAMASSVVVVGAGFIGTEVASSARELGLDVTVVEAADAPLSRALGPMLGERLGRVHAESGSRLLCGTSIVSIENARRVEQVVLEGGSTVDAQLIVVGVGTQPNTEWLGGSGLDVSDGVLCDQRGRAVGAESVYAVGDVARWASPRFGDAIRTEHWAATSDQAQAIAADILRQPQPPEAVPYVWSDQFGRRIQIAGRCGAEHDVMIVRDDDEAFVAITGRAGRLASVVSMDDQRRFGAFRRLISRDASWDAALEEARTQENR